MSLSGRATREDQVERSRLIRAQAEKVERQNLVETGNLVEAESVKLEWADMCVTIRQRLLAIPARIAARYPDPKLRADLDREIRAALDELANDL